MIAGHLQEKYGFFYIVLSYRDENGKRHTPWFPTKLPVKGNKKRAEALLLEMRQTYQPPELAGKTAAQEQAQPELMFTDFLQQWLEVAKSTIQLTTYASYAGMMRSAILPYFLERDIRLEQLTAKDIQDFYSFPAGQRQHRDTLSRGDPRRASVCGEDGSAAGESGG